MASSFKFGTYILDVFMYYCNQSPVSLVDDHMSFVHCHMYTGSSCLLTRKKLISGKLTCLLVGHQPMM